MRFGSVFGFLLAVFAVAIFLQFAALPSACETKSKSDSFLDSLKELGDSLKELEDSIKELDDVIKGKKTAEENDKQPAETPQDTDSEPEGKEEADSMQSYGQSEEPEGEQKPARRFRFRRNLKASDKVYIKLADDDTEEASGLEPDDRLWAKPSAEMLSPVPDIPPMKITPPLEINDMTQAQYNGAVSAAMEGMRELMGELSEEEEAKFNAKWAPMFGFPTQEIVEYLNKLNPLLAEFLSLRGAMASACVEFDAAWEEAVLAASYDSEEGAEEALSLAAMQRDFLLSLNARMVEVARAIQELGNPPSPIEAQARARKRHKESMEIVNKIVPKVKITPTNATAEEGKPYELTAQVQNVSGKVTINWAFGDGTVVTNASTNVSHTYKKAGNFAIRAAVYDANKTKVAEGNAQVSVDPGQPASAGKKGMWVQTDIWADKVSPPNEDYPDRSYWEFFDNAAECKHYMQKEFRSHYRYTWDEPPVKLTPGEKLTLKVGIRALPEATYKSDNANLQLNFRGISGTGKSALAELYSAEVRESNKKEVLDAAVLNLPATGSTSGTLEIWVEIYQGGRHIVKKYSYKYDKNASADSTAPTPAPVKADAEEEEETPEQAAERARKESTEFHKMNIEIIEGHLAKDRAELSRETDPERRAAIEFSIMHKMSDLQAEKDLIASIETGVHVHTRTPFDDYAHAQFIQSIVDNQREMEAFQRSSAGLYRLAAMLPGSEAQEARDFIDRQLTMDVRAKMDQAIVKRIANALDNKVQGYYEGEAAKNEELAAWEDFGLQASQNIKTAADFSLMACSLMGGRPIEVLYQATTGYIEGGPAEAALNVVSTFGTAAYTSVEAFKGYREGGWEKAATRGAKAFVTSKAIEYGVTKAMQGFKPKSNKPSVKEQFELAQFKKARADGEALVKDFNRAQLQIEAAAGKAGSAKELIKMQAQLRDKAAAINASPHAKNFLKYKGNLHTQNAYNAHMKAVHAEVEAKFHTAMTKHGWNKQQLVEFRNAASANSVGMDHDIGLMQSSTMKLFKNGQRGTVRQWQSDAQKSWEQAYHEVTKRSARRSWENVTTSAHAESYRDLAWLGADKSKVKAAWAQQTADVTRYKANHMLNDKSLTRMEALQEASRGTAKDIDTKLKPMLARVKPANDASAKALSRTKDHWDNIFETLRGFGRNDIDPITAERTIRELTGGKSIPEVVDDMGTLLESLVSAVGT